MKLHRILVAKILVMVLLPIITVTSCFFAFPSLEPKSPTETATKEIPPKWATYIAWGNLPEPNLGDGGIISEQPCGPPCFQNIIPGITTEEEARKILNEIGEPCIDFDNTIESGYRGVECHQVNMAFVDNLVPSLGFYPSRSVTLGEILDKYGSPDRVSVYISSVLPDYPPRTTMRLYYDRLLTIIDLTEQDGEEFTPSSDTVVRIIGYDTPTGYRDYLNFIADETASFSIGTIPWDGFVTYPANPKSYP